MTDVESIAVAVSVSFAVSVAANLLTGGSAKIAYKRFADAPAFSMPVRHSASRELTRIECIAAVIGQKCRPIQLDPGDRAEVLVSNGSAELRFGIAVDGSGKQRFEYLPPKEEILAFSAATC